MRLLKLPWLTLKTMLKPTKHGPQRSQHTMGHGLCPLSPEAWDLRPDARRSKSTWNRQTSAETHPVGFFSRIVLDSMPPKTHQNTKKPPAKYV